MCSLQLNVFYEFKKKVLLNHERFTKAICDSIKSTEIEVDNLDSVDESAEIVANDTGIDVPEKQTKISSKQKMGPKSRVKRKLSIEEDPPALCDDQNSLLSLVSDETPNDYVVDTKSGAKNPINIRNKSSAVDSIIYQKQIKPEAIDEEDELKRISRYLCETQANKSERMLTAGHIKEEIFDNMEIHREADEYSDDLDYFEEYYLEEADLLEGGGDTGTSIRNYDNRNSPTFSEIYLEEEGTEFAIDDDPSDNTDGDSEYIVERLMDDVEFEDTFSLVTSKLSGADKLELKPRLKRHTSHPEKETHVCVSCQLVFTKYPEYRQHM